MDGRERKFRVNFVVMIMFRREISVLFGVKYVSGVRKRIIL